MKSTVADTIKSIIIIALVILLGVLASMRLVKLQIVGGNDIITSPKHSSTAVTIEREITPTRGEIMDYRGNTIIGNDSCNDIVLQKAFFPEDIQEGNRILLDIYNNLAECGYTFEEVLPITLDKPYAFTTEDTSRIVELLKLNVYSTAENCVDKLISDYEIAEDYTDAEKRIIGGLRYAMLAKDFSYSNDLLLVTDVDQTTIIKMKELSNICRGIGAVDSAERNIIRGDILPHQIGTIGPIWAEEYDELKELGYAMNEQVGKSGIEYAMEKELRGEAGVEEVTIDNGAIVDIRTTKETVPGQTVKLTVDGAFQIQLQEVLDNFLKNFGYFHGEKVEKGAIVVLDAKTGAVRGMANAPSYNLRDFIENYEALAADENAPMFDRCAWGQYLPGSTFKTVTATAGLNEGVISSDTCYYCGGARSYEFYGSRYGCTGTHYNIAVRHAIEVSCNCFFYETSRNLGIDNITKYSKLYGLGSSLGLETGDAAGFLCNPETFAQRGQTWYIGYVIQAGIGNQDCGFSPLQMATVANTIANRGVRYKPYLVDSLYTFGTNELQFKTKPTVAERIPLSYDGVYDSIIAGMIDASHNVPAPYSLTGLGYDVAIKTGTPQTTDEYHQNSVFIGFAPADDPEIAFAGVIENGEYSKYMIRGILDAYSRCYGLNGSAPSAELPPEVRNGTTASTSAAVTTTGDSTTVVESTETTVTTAA